MRVNYNWYTDFSTDSTLWAVRFYKFRELNKYWFTTIQKAREYVEEVEKDFEKSNSLSPSYYEDSNKSHIFDEHNLAEKTII